MFYYDLVRFLNERLRSQTPASTYVYYYSNPPVFDLDNILRRVPNMIGHFAELDLAWGVPYFSTSNRSNMAYTMNIDYKHEEAELSYQLIRYWTNFAKTGECTSTATSCRSFVYLHRKPERAAVRVPALAHVRADDEILH